MPRVIALGPRGEEGHALGVVSVENLADRDRRGFIHDSRLFARSVAGKASEALLRELDELGITDESGFLQTGRAFYGAPGRS